MNSSFFKFAKRTYFNYPCPRKLRDLIHMSLIEREPVHQVQKIWKEFHESKEGTIGYDVDKDSFSMMLKK